MIVCNITNDCNYSIKTIARSWSNSGSCFTIFNERSFGTLATEQLIKIQRSVVRSFKWALGYKT